MNFVRKWLYWVCKNIKKCDCTESEFSSQMRWQQLSACMAGQGEVL